MGVVGVANLMRRRSASTGFRLNSSELLLWTLGGLQEDSRRAVRGRGSLEDSGKHDTHTDPLQESSRPLPSPPSPTLTLAPPQAPLAPPRVR